MIYLNPKKSIAFVPKSQMGLADASVFHVKPLTVEEENEVKDSIYKDGRACPYHQYSKAFELGVTDVTNLVNELGDPVKYSAIPEIIEMIPRSIRDEVAMKVLEMLEGGKDAKEGKEELKN